MRSSIFEPNSFNGNPWVSNFCLYIETYSFSLSLFLVMGGDELNVKSRPYFNSVSSKNIGKIGMFLREAKKTSFLTFKDSTAFSDTKKTTSEEFIKALSTTSCHLSPEIMPSSYHMLYPSSWNRSISG